MPLEVREEWLAQVAEEVLEPDRRIVDAHHHFFEAGEGFPFYDLSSLWADTQTHRVEQTVYLQCWEGYRKTGPEEMMVVGETEWVDRIATQAAKCPQAAQIGAIVGTAELRLGAKVRPILQAHRQASELFRGIRLIAAWDELAQRKRVNDAPFTPHRYGSSRHRQPQQWPLHLRLHSTVKTLLKPTVLATFWRTSGKLALGRDSRRVSF